MTSGNTCRVSERCLFRPHTNAFNQFVQISALEKVVCHVVLLSSVNEIISNVNMLNLSQSYFVLDYLSDLCSCRRTLENQENCFCPRRYLMIIGLFKYLLLVLTVTYSSTAVH